MPFRSFRPKAWPFARLFRNGGWPFIHNHLSVLPAPFTRSPHGLLVNILSGPSGLLHPQYRSYAHHWHCGVASPPPGAGWTIPTTIRSPLFIHRSTSKDTPASCCTHYYLASQCTAAARTSHRPSSNTRAELGASSCSIWTLRWWSATV